jgi:hypothetical protein
VAAALVVAGVLSSPRAGAISSTPAPVAEPGAHNVTADALPTVQIDGVVWSQAIVGNRVYAGGRFGYARPAGAAPGTQRVRRTNLLAYDITTGKLITSFAPTVNGEVKTVVRSPNGSRIYVGGTFTTVNGRPRGRIAAFSAATGALISTFAPPINFTVDAITATDTRVYVGGAFTAVGSAPRTRLAAFDATNGALMAWHPIADATVLALVIVPFSPTLVVGGAFQNISGTPVYGLSALDRHSGAVRPFPANDRVRNYGAGGAIDSLSTDGTSVYGTGYAFHTGGGQGTLEGTFSSTPGGTLRWVEDCNGDSYGTHAAGGVLYVVTHAHDCATVGGFPDTTNPRVAHRALAFTVAPMGTLSHRFLNFTYTDWGGTPAPAMYNWFPDLQAGTFTGQGQAAWNVTGNGTYVVMGGEFPKVNGVGQQGLVRFAVRPPAPGLQGPQVRVAPTVSAQSSTSARITWPTSWDRDNERLTYQVIRNGNLAAPVYTATATSQFWNRPTLSFVNIGLRAGTRYTYRIRVVDARGNSLTSGDVAVTTQAAANAAPSPAAGVIAADSFARAATDGWGSADTGGGWTVDGAPAGDFSVASRAATMRVLAHGSALSAYLPGVLVGDSDSLVDVSFDRAFEGTDAGRAAVTARHSGSAQYRLRATVRSGAVDLSLTKSGAGTETVMATQTISGLSITPGQALRLRLLVGGKASVALAGKAWAVGSAEPAAWQVTARDSSAALGVGDSGLAASESGIANKAPPFVATFANFKVVLLTGPWNVPVK